MPDSKKYGFFLASNSRSGFYSAFDGISTFNGISRIYILKGGPGCGKSTFMKKLADAAVGAGGEAELIYCSSDPSSLDAVLLRDFKIAVVDGTSPHVTEPKYPAAFETYISFADFWDGDEIARHLTRIKSVVSSIGGCYQSAYEALSASCLMRDRVFGRVVSQAPLERIRRRAQGIAKRTIAPKTGDAVINKRFLSGITPDGVVCLFDTVNTLCNTVYEISDSFGLSHFMLSEILSHLSGYELYACYCPLDPQSKLEHLIIPELSLAFVTTNSHLKYPGIPARHIRLDPYLPRDAYLRYKADITLYTKLADALLDSAVSSLYEAKALHDELEKYYIPNINFGGINALLQALISKHIKK